METIYKLKTIAGILMLGAAGYQAVAQDETDALRYSTIQPQGTARSMGFGSALGSVGGDFSTLSVNPAGLGIYRRSEMMITPSVTIGGSDAKYAGNNSDGSGAHFAISNFGIVWTSAPKGKRYERTPWKAVSFGIGLNRLADFTRDYNYAGTNTTSSGSWVFQNSANDDPANINRENTLGYLGYQSYLINPAPLSTGGIGYLSVVNPSEARPIRQFNSVKERGGISEITMSLGGNYMEHLMIGATLGMPYVNYTRHKIFEEEDMLGVSTDSFSNFRYTEDLHTSGLGINLKFGLIYKPIDAFRIGAAIHTPTYFGLTDAQDANLTTNTGSYKGVYSVDAAQNQYDYTLKTPWRGIVSATAMLGKYGFITADYEYVDYKSMRYTFDDASYQSYMNGIIKNNFQGASNVRAGLEIKPSNLFLLRAGVGYYGNPYKSGSTYASGEHLDISGGIGLRMASTFVDLAYVHRAYKNNEQPYSVSYPGITVATANLENKQSMIALTVGWKF